MSQKPARRRWYVDRIAALTHSGNLYAMTALVLSQVIYLNLHYVIGASIASVAIASLLIQILMSLISSAALQKQKTERVEHLLYWHFVLNHCVILAFVPLFIWTVVVMIQRAAT